MRVYVFLLFFGVLLSCKTNEEPIPEFQFCQLAPIDSLIQDTVFYSSSVTVFEGLEYTSYPLCDYEKVDSFPNYKNAIVDAYLYEDIIEDKKLNRISILTFDVIEHCQKIPDSTANDFSLLGNWQFQHITFGGDTLLPPCEINYQSMTFDSTHVSGGHGGCEAMIYEDWYSTANNNDCVFILTFPENQDIADFYDAQYRLFIGVDSVHYTIKKNFLVLNNPANQTSAVLFKKAE